MAAVQQLQRTVGNRAAGQYLQHLQRHQAGAAAHARPGQADAVVQRMPPPGAPRQSASLLDKQQTAWDTNVWSTKNLGERPPWSDTDTLREVIYVKYEAAGLAWQHEKTGVKYVFCAACALPNELHKMDLDHVYEWSTIHQRLRDGLGTNTNGFSGFDPYVRDSSKEAVNVSEWGARSYSEDMDNLQLICGRVGEGCNQRKNGFTNEVNAFLIQKKTIFSEEFFKWHNAGRIKYTDEDKAQPLLDGKPISLTDLIINIMLGRRTTDPAVQNKLNFMQENQNQISMLQATNRLTANSLAFTASPMIKTLPKITAWKERAQEMLVGLRSLQVFLVQELKVQKSTEAKKPKRPSYTDRIVRALKEGATRIPELTVVDVATGRKAKGAGVKLYTDSLRKARKAIKKYLAED